MIEGSNLRCGVLEMIYHRNLLHSPNSVLLLIYNQHFLFAGIQPARQILLHGNSQSNARHANSQAA